MFKFFTAVKAALTAWSAQASGPQWSVSALSV
jgi:hypothetical protein